MFREKLSRVVRGIGPFCFGFDPLFRKIVEPNRGIAGVDNIEPGGAALLRVKGSE
jgi:hypothetical protein